ncbi:hypothetical protein EK21DRAFT_74521 [Setomelanomma holmii]|uniref:Heterokaryon incompatibility domain-containing protein n=1 Tax=Setomelanomma holmii TaxID=210430 RepID=A0A9P4H2A5_9PLEO|nr:hypothetical protein EK21DRAFT_74521 [Setomelanomma holmii]
MRVSKNLWIDAIYINQADNAEKAKKVMSVSHIYERATKAHVWLGSATEGNDIPSVFALFQDWLFYKRRIFEMLGSSLTAFLMRPWFTRRWVLQEVTQTYAVTLHCGSFRLPWA